MLALTKMAIFFIILCILGKLFTIYTGHGRLWGLIPLFDLNKENNFPTYFSMLLLLCSSGLLTLITAFDKNRASSYSRHWATLACGFLYLSVDEIISLHESLSAPTRFVLGNKLPSFFYWSWVIPALLIILFLTLYFFKFLLHLSAQARWVFILSGATYLFGAIGMEMVGGHYAELYGTQSNIYFSCTLIEESLELTGVIIFIYGLLQYIGENFSDIIFQVKLGE